MYCTNPVKLQKQLLLFLTSSKFCFEVFFVYFFYNFFIFCYVQFSIGIAYSCLFLDTHSQHYEKIFFSSLYWVFFNKNFHWGFDAPNVKSVLTQETLKLNWAWETFNQSEVWMEQKKCWMRGKERKLGALAEVKFYFSWMFNTNRFKIINSFGLVISR
jgi:hypothetical protein